MRLSAGIRLGTYEVVAPLGVGGMGEVYRARDVRLGRDVAIKILTVSFAADAERIRRFEREAKTLALLNHPNIAAIYGFEDSGDAPALVMELVEGATLADLIKSGPIPVDEVVLIAKQIAEGMEYAHERGIVHRDLKPANVKVSRDDSVKILDFGLAKAVEGEAAETDIATSPTLTGMATQAGFIIGTAAYMSPEQAKGKPVDRRADIWAFGCVFYEMLTGKVAFGGETVTDILAAVVRAEPDWSQLPAGTPLRARVLLQRCLQKDPKQRLRDIGDARISLDEIISGAALEAPAPGEVAAASRWARALPWALAGLLAAALIAVVAVWKIAAHATMPEAAMHFSAVTEFPGVQAQPSLSPDGRSVAFVSNRDGHYDIYVALASGGSLVKITNDPNLKSHPAWSPDGAMIAYARLNDSGIWDVWDVPALGGAPRRLILNAADPSWSPDSRSLTYGNMADNALWICGVSGENAHKVEGTADREWIDAEPHFSPDGRRIAFVARNSDGGPYGELAVAELDSGKTRLLTHNNALVLSPAWSPDGGFIYFASSRGGTLNIWKIGADGSAPQQITAGEGDDAELDVSADGKRIVFSTLREHVSLAQLDLQAKAGQRSVKLISTDSARNQYGPVYSPDGSHLAYFSSRKGIDQAGISIADADGSNATPLVQDTRVNVFPRWTPGGKYLVYRSAATVFDKWEYRRVALSGGAPQTLLTGDRLPSPEVGPDGRLLFPGPNGKVEAFDPRDNKTETLGTLPANARFRRWSPDGHSVAYVVSPSEEDDANSGLWTDDFKNPPRQIFHGWVVRYASGPGNEVYLLEGKADLNGVLWKVGWDGQGLTRTSATIPIIYNLNYLHTQLSNQFDVSPDAHHVAFLTEQILEENIGMIENVR